MKILFLSNSDISNDLFYWLKTIYLDDIVRYSEKIDLRKIKNINPSIIISYNYRYYITKDIIDYMNNGIINLHISLLPWNRGAYPNIWSFLKNTPKGVSIHQVNEVIDGGDIIVQKEVIIDEMKETLSSSYILLHTEIQKLFKDNWNDIINRKLEPIPQNHEGSLQTVKDFEKIKPLIYDWNMPIIELKKSYKEMMGIKEV